MATLSLTSSVLAFTVRKCPHIGQDIKYMASVPDNTMLTSILQQHHEEKGSDVTIYGKTELAESAETFVLESGLLVGDLKKFGVKCIVFQCNEKKRIISSSEAIETAAIEATTKTVNAFEVLMASGRAFPTIKKSSSGIGSGGLSRKDELYNDLVEKFLKSKRRDFPRLNANTEGQYITQVLCNALWYVTNQHQTINDTARTKKDVLPVPSEFEAYQGYNELKRKKMKSLPMDVTGLDRHAQALYSILQKPVMNSSLAWKEGASALQKLADCLSAYKEYLKLKNNEVKHNQSLDHPVRTIAKDATVEHREPSSEIKEKYVLLDSAVRDKPELQPVFFDEDVHLLRPFETPLQRLRFIQDLQLSIPVDLVRFSPGGSTITSLFLCKVKKDRSESQLLIDGARLLQDVRPQLLECHTRAQRKIFRDKIRNITKMSPAILDFIYKELSLDGSAASHPVTQERLRLITLGHTNLVADLRHLNPGRPNNTFDTFFDTLSGLVEEITVADDRRHGEAHMSEFISLRELVEKAASKCPPETKIPSKSLVRLQFAPRNPYCKGATNFTSRINVQYKIQRRQLRLTHIDAHYCNAQFKYLKEFAIEHKDTCVLLCCDDKAKVPFGEPGAAVSTGVRGKKSIVPTSDELVSLDHDMTKGSLTPSVVLNCAIPDRIDKSFVRGKVTTIVNDSVFETASPFRHTAVLTKILKTNPPPVVLKFTDGGTDQRNTLESVRCADICLFRELGLDMLIHGRCAPGMSYTNPAERVMSVLNLGLQNVSLQRKKVGEQVEAVLKNKNSMTEIRAANENYPDLHVKESWTESLEPVKSLVRNRFLRLKLKDDPVQAIDPVSEDEIDIIKHHLREIFPDLETNKLQKQYTKKDATYQKWVQDHCKMTHYVFQVKKCNDTSCCLPPVLQNLRWLPDPVIDESGEHYKPYSYMKSKMTTEKDRPSLKKTLDQKANGTQKMPQEEPPCASEASTSEISDENFVEIPVSDTSLCTVQNARLICTCVECRKPRVVFSRHRLTMRQQMTVAIDISEYDYTCGSPLLPPTNPLHKTVMCKSNMNCQTPLELAYYKSGLGIATLCCYCISDEGEVHQDLLKNFKTVLPICKTCEEDGLTPVVQRPYAFGKKK